LSEAEEDQETSEDSWFLIRLSR